MKSGESKFGPVFCNFGSPNGASGALLCSELGSGAPVLHFSCRDKQYGIRGFTFVELMVATTVIMILISIALPYFGSYVDKAKGAKATADMRHTLQTGIELYEFTYGSMPVSLASIPKGEIPDPWGHVREYLSFSDLGEPSKGNARKDFLAVPLNTDFDLYSKGRDGESDLSVSASVSLDDIIRANNGGYVG